MAQFIESVAGDVLRTVTIELLESLLVRILLPRYDSSKLRVLLPEVGFKELSRSQEPQDGHVTRGNLATCLGGFGSSGQQGTASQSCSGYADAFEKRAAPDAVRISRLGRRLSCFGRCSGDEVFCCHGLRLQSFQK